MYKKLIGERVNIVVSSRSDNILEYMGTLVSETDDAIELENADISYLMLNFQRGMFGEFGENIRKYKEKVEKVIINKRYIISCDK